MIGKGEVGAAVAREAAGFPVALVARDIAGDSVEAVLGPSENTVRGGAVRTGVVDEAGLGLGVGRAWGRAASTQLVLRCMVSVGGGLRGGAGEGRLTLLATVARRGGAGAARDLAAKPGRRGLRERTSARCGGSVAQVGREAGRRGVSCTVDVLGRGGLRERTSARCGGSAARVGREAGRRGVSCTVDVLGKGEAMLLAGLGNRWSILLSASSSPMRIARLAVSRKAGSIAEGREGRGHSRTEQKRPAIARGVPQVVVTQCGHVQTWVHARKQAANRHSFFCTERPAHGQSY